jgi:heme exporter protein D
MPQAIPAFATWAASYFAAGSAAAYVAYAVAYTGATLTIGAALSATIQQQLERPSEGGLLQMKVDSNHPRASAGSEQ